MAARSAAVILDAWKTRHANAQKLQTTLESRLANLNRQESLLEEAYIFEKKIDATTYERRRDVLREDIALVRLELEDLRLETLDVEDSSAMRST